MAKPGRGLVLMDFYNRERPHQALDYRTPGEVFQEERVALLAAVETLRFSYLASSLSK